MTVHFVPEDCPARGAGTVPSDRKAPGTTGARLPAGEPAVRVAYAVGRTTGGAVVRNLCRRRLRVITAEIAPELPPGSYLVRVGPGIDLLHFEELRERVSTTMRSASGAR